MAKERKAGAGGKPEHEVLEKGEDGTYVSALDRPTFKKMEASRKSTFDNFELTIPGEPGEGDVTTSQQRSFSFSGILGSSGR